MESKHTDIYNVGSSKSYSLSETMEMLRKELGCNITAGYIENPMKNYVMIAKAYTQKKECSGIRNKDWIC